MARRGKAEAKEEALAWWRAALAGKAPPINSEPQCGFFRRRLIKDGPWVPVAIWYADPPRDAEGHVVGDGPLRAAVNGAFADPLETWLWVAANPISEGDYNSLVRDAKDRHGGRLPSARVRIDLLTVPLPTFKPGEMKCLPKTHSKKLPPA